MLLSAPPICLSAEGPPVFDELTWLGKSLGLVEFVNVVGPLLWGDDVDSASVVKPLLAEDGVHGKMSRLLKSIFHILLTHTIWFIH